MSDMVTIWVEKSFTNNPNWPPQYMLSEIPDGYTDGIEVPVAWWVAYVAAARRLSEMQAYAAKKAGFEND